VTGLPPIEAVVFDFGGVISSPLFRGIGDFERESGYPRGSLLRLLFGETHYIGAEGRAVAAGTEAADAPEQLHDWHRLECGTIDFDEYFRGLEARAPAILGRPLDLEAYARFMRRSSVGVHWPVVHRARELKARRIKIGLLTNNVKEFGDHWRATFPCDELFEVVVDSSHVGMRKPDPAIYRLTCERLRVEPGAAVFVDDNADNVATARALGMETVHFDTDPWEAMAELDAILERRGTRPTG
jgi:putative hydrolase of the HAD superfamily